MVNIGSALAQGAIVAVTIKAIDEFSGTFKKAEGGLFSIQNVAKVGVSALAGFATALGAVGVSSIKVAADFEQTKIAFTTMLGSAEEAEIFLKDLADFAKKTPFTLQGVESAARKLMAVGFEAKEVIPTLKTVGDIASGLGLGQEGLDRLILNLGQVQAQGKLTGRELRDFAVAGIPLLDELAKSLGKTSVEIQDMVSAGEITTEMVIKSFENMTGAGGRFEDLMTKQMDSVKGRFSNLQDAMELMQRELGAAILPSVSKLADVFLEEVLPAIQPLIPIFADFFVGILESVIPILPEIVSLLSELSLVFLDIFKSLEPVIDPLITIIHALAGPLLEIIKPLIPLIEQLAMLLASLAPILIALEPAFQAIAKIIEIISLGIQVLISWLTQLVDYFSNKVGKVISSIGGVVNKVAGLAGGNTKKVGDAIIRPNGQIIETDPRDTLIATKNPNGLGGGSTIVINIDTIYGMDPEELSRALSNELNKKLSL